MYRRMPRAWRVMFCASFLAIVSGPVAGAEVPSAEARTLDAAAHHLSLMLLGEKAPAQRPPLTSDLEHARSIDPVMTRGAVIWIHDALPSPPLTVIGGRVFCYRDVPYDPLDDPILKIRPIDDDQRIPFLVRVEIEPRHDLPLDAMVSLSFPAPLIFDPRLDHVEARVDSKVARVAVQRSHRDSLLTARISLTPADEDAPRLLGEIITVTIRGEIVLKPYRRQGPARFDAVEHITLDTDVAELARLEIDRDIANAGERERLEQIADGLGSRSPSDYDRVLAVNSWVGKYLRYEEGPASRSAIQALEDRSGDCDEHTSLTAVLLRALGIPARRVTGLLYNLDTLAPHTWVEVALPTRQGDLSWFIVDPTLARTASSEKEKAAFVQYGGRVLLYPFKPTIRLEGGSGRLTSDVLLNWKNSATAVLGPNELDSLVERTIAETDGEISRGAERLASAGLMLSRESASIAGSQYLLVDRPLTDDRPSRVHLRLENEERLLLELVAGEGTALESASEVEMIERLRSVYSDINSSLFNGVPAHYNLELFYTRDRYDDRLTTVSLRIGRYLMEHFLERTLNRLSRSGLLKEHQAAWISAVAAVSGGKNLYLIQELARQLPPADPQ